MTEILVARILNTSISVGLSIAVSVVALSLCRKKYSAIYKTKWIKITLLHQMYQSQS